MEIYKISNGEISITVNKKGAELVSLQKASTEKEYMWNGDAYFWNKTSPILFPVVGCHKGFKYQHEGVEYELGQHGFARDMYFTCSKQTEDELWFSLEDTEETCKVYPFSFLLEVGYVLKGKKVEVIWKVKNKGTDRMYFSIGGHPGFLIPEDSKDGVGAYIQMEARNNVVSSRQINNRLAIDGFLEYKLEDGRIPITKQLFAHDALVLEDNQIDSIQILDEKKKAFIKVNFDTPIIAIWAPAHLEEKAPFVCIEPWYGRCDHENFVGDLKDREYAQSLVPGNVFTGGYEIEVF